MLSPVTEPNRAGVPAAGPAQVGFFATTIGKKIVMAVTGVILCGFVLGHMIGNLQAFAPDGGAALDAYGALLRHLGHGMALWVARAGLLLATALHIWAFVSLFNLNRRARPQGYRVTDYQEATLASRAMKVTGPILLVFIVYHLLHMTTGTVHPQFEEGRVYHNLISGLSVLWVALFYLVAMAALALHLWHGTWSMLQTLGASHPRFNPWRKRLATAFTLVVCLGFAIVPVAVLVGWIR